MHGASLLGEEGLVTDLIPPHLGYTLLCLEAAVTSPAELVPYQRPGPRAGS